MQKYNVIVIGAGPAGTSCAIRLAESGLKILLLDKAIFPRDKICGDALSVDVLNQLPMLSTEIEKSFELNKNKFPSWGVSIFSPDHTRLDIPFVYKGKSKNGFICARENFDDMLFRHVKNTGKIEVLENCRILKVSQGLKEVIVQTNTSQYSTDLLIGADGANSIVKRSLKSESIAKNHYSAGLRVYYEGVTSFHQQGYIELYFFKDILPGYCWVFPMTNNRANVGIGVLSSTVSEKKMNLKKILDNLLKTNPTLKERFVNATPLEDVKGFGLPLGTSKREISGERFLLIGDAAGLIDPFSGEGIGNAIRSGRVAAEHVINCFREGDFSAQFNKQYDQEIYKRMGGEFKISKALQTLCRSPYLFNFVIRKASNSPYWREFFTKALADINYKKSFLNPVFYYRLLFK